MSEEFTKTKEGKKLLSFDIPRLIESLDRLTSAITASNKIEEKKLLIEQRRILNEKNHAGTS